MRDLYARVGALATSGADLLVLGEPGVGKTRFVEAVAARAGRSGPFLKLDCVALPPAIVASELFDDDVDASRGGMTSKLGGGLVFLREIAELPLDLQARLARALALGASGGDAAADVRVIASSSRDVAALVQEGAFDRGLYAQLAVASVTIPPLRDREDDVLPLARAFLAEAAGQAPVPELTPEVEARLLSHAWFGNVRELRAVMERARRVAQGKELGPEHLLFGDREPPEPMSSRRGLYPWPSPASGALPSSPGSGYSSSRLVETSSVPTLPSATAADRDKPSPE
jgi:DNA-binding NtrC family response regulator